ncbi:MAG: MlaD family protein [Armatimonadota bacterium]|nr:MlaD family protein [Armatimonadota bacterium]
MLRFRPEARVGLLIFVGIVTLIAIYWFLSGSVFRARTYTVYAVFRSVQRLDRGAAVRMAGVQVGQVISIRLTKWNRARVEMAIRQDVSIPEGSAFRVTSGGLVGDIYVEIVPGSGPGRVGENKTVYGADTTTLDQLLPQASQLLAQLQTSAQALNGILADKRLLASMRQTMANSEMASRQAANLMADFRRIAAENRVELNTALNNASAASEDFAALAEKMRGIMDRGGAQDVEAMLESGKTAAANLQQASEKLKQLASDEQLTGDLKATMANLRKASENAEALTERLSRVLGRRDRGERKPIRGEGSSLDFFANLGSNRYRVDYNLTIPNGADRFYRLGLFGIGDATKVNVQLGQTFDADTALRYGLYASKLGVGYDRYFGKTSLHADLFGLNDTKLELKGRYDLRDDLGVWLGFDDLLDERGLLLGVQYRK